MVAWKMKESYEEREYCVQYAESDLHFISRLCEEEGIYFWFEHSEKTHTLCFSDTSGGPFIDGTAEGSLRFYPGSGNLADSSVIKCLNLRQRINSDKSTYREWNFTQPPLDLEAMQFESDDNKAPVPGGLKLEKYQYPHLYDLRSPGDRYADIQLLRQLTYAKWVEGESDVTRLLPGFTFTLYDHSRKDLNARWWLTGVTHFGEQPQVLEDEAPDRGFVYKNTFEAIPFETRFVPEIKHPKKRIDGLQSAIVTGPGGEEVHVDKYGRIKVQFHWDRLGQHDENTTCWIRVADVWAGRNFGFIQPPRLGQEVLVEFMEGDPDRPVATGRAYNAKNMPPWELPSQKALSGIQSSEFRGDQRNQLVMDDTEGEVQAQLSNDHELSQLNLGYITRVNHMALTTDGNFSTTTGQSLTASAGRRISLFAQGSGMKLFAAQGKVEIQAQSNNVEISADQLINIISAHDQVKISAPKEILLTAGGSYLKINAAGVESGTSGKFVAHAASHSFVGPKKLSPQIVNFINASKLAKPACEACEKLKQTGQAKKEQKSPTGVISEVAGVAGTVAGIAGAVSGAKLAGSISNIAGAIGGGLASLTQVLIGAAPDSSPDGDGTSGAFGDPKATGIIWL